MHCTVPRVPRCLTDRLTPSVLRPLRAQSREDVCCPSTQRPRSVAALSRSTHHPRPRMCTFSSDAPLPRRNYKGAWLNAWGKSLLSLRQSVPLPPLCLPFCIINTTPSSSGLVYLSIQLYAKLISVTIGLESPAVFSAVWCAPCRHPPSHGDARVLVNSSCLAGTQQLYVRHEILVAVKIYRWGCHVLPMCKVT